MSRGRAVVVVGAFVASLLWVLVTPWCTRDRVGDVNLWVNAVRAHRALLQSGDTLLVHPPWRDDVVTALAQSGVVPAGVEVTVAFAPASNEPFPPLWVLRERDGLPLPRRLADAVTTAVDVAAAPLRFERLAASTGIFDLATLLPRATVTVTEENGDVTRCRFDGERHTCPGQPAWIHVGVEDVPVGGQSARCIWAHPKTGAVVRVAFDDVPLLQTLTLSLGLSDTAAQTPGGAAVEAQLFVDDALVNTLRRRGQRGFGTATVDVAAGRRARVAVELRTPNDAQRHTCFQLVTAGAP